MPRPQRIEYPGAWYHVMNRGAGRRMIFRTNAQRQGLLDLLGEVCEIYGIAVHAYCLVGNHYHLLIHTPRGNLSAAMRHLNSVYTQRFNRSIGTDGPLFRGRYKAVVVEADNYLAQLSRYIHLNPAAAGVSPRADQYRWSSYGAYLGKRRAPAWLHRDVTLALFGARRARERYRAFVEQGVDEELKAFYGKKNLSSILGSAGFLRALRRKQQAKVLPKPARRATLPSLQRIAQASAAKRWLASRQAELLPVEYYHVVFTLPAPIADIAYQNKALVYDLLFKAAAETLLTIAADKKHLGARIGLTAVLHTWGSTLTHHPHVHCIVPGGGFGADGERWMRCRPGFFLPVRVLSRLFRRLFLEQLRLAHDSGQLEGFGPLQPLAHPRAFAEFIKPLGQIEWVVYAKRPFAGPETVLAYLSRYTHRVAISNSRLLAFDPHGVTFKYKDYRDKGRYRQKTMTLATPEFIRRFLIHVLPKGFHRIRYYGLFANAQRTEHLTRARALLLNEQTQAGLDEGATSDEGSAGAEQPPSPTYVCPACGAPMLIIETFDAAHAPRAPPTQQRAA